MRPGTRCTLLALLVAATPVQAQTMRERFLNLFTFGTCGSPLCLSVDAGRHEKHFIPSVVQGADNLLGFLTDAVGTSIANVPVAAASGGTTFMFVDGAPVATSTSAGPIFGERAPTLGRGRWFFGANVTGVNFKTIRGIPLNDLNLTFVHQNVADSALGNPRFEDDLLQVNTAARINMLVSSVVIAYGLLDRVDLAVNVPFVRSSISGHSTATILPDGTGIDSLAHFFGSTGTKSLTATSNTSGSASGVGDVLARIKVNAIQKDRVGLSLLGGVRFPTGDENQFLGTGGTDVLGMGVLSARAGTLTPHINVGYIHRGAKFENNAILTTAGVDNVIGRRATLAIDLISSWQVGTSKLVTPGPVTFNAPLIRHVQLTDIPNERDNVVDAAVGTKISASDRLNFVGNALLPVNRGGVRANAVWTLGVEYNFYPHRAKIVSAP